MKKDKKCKGSDSKKIIKTRFQLGSGSGKSSQVHAATLYVHTLIIKSIFIHKNKFSFHSSFVSVSSALSCFLTQRIVIYCLNQQLTEINPIQGLELFDVSFFYHSDLFALFSCIYHILIIRCITKLIIIFLNHSSIK
jgi:hypothetical protein